MACQWIVAWTLVTGLGCASAATQQARDPMQCERDPACAKARLAYPDCSKQCADDPECVQRCAEVESHSDGLGH
ncbi:MAG TPA: hypothetical protein VGM06_08575 [Polyangiaceae bacterium]|jgi:hypothetical protein